MVEPDADVRSLIDAARRGDGAAMEQLLRSHRDYLLRLAHASLGRRLRSKLDASDIAQDVLLKAQQGLGAFRGGTEEEFLAWLRQVVSRTVNDADRRYRRNAGRCTDRERSLDALAADSSQAPERLPAGNHTSPSRGAQRREVHGRVREALAALKADDRTVILLRSVDALSWEEVGERMGRTAEAARALWGRAYGRLGAVVEGRQWTAP